MANRFSLTALFEALHDSVSKATEVAYDHSLSCLTNTYFEPVIGDDGNPTGTLKPKLLRLAMPHHKGDEISVEEFEVPIYSLVKHQSMLIDTLKVSFEVDLHGLENLPENTDSKHMVLASSAIGVFGTKPTTAKVEIAFKGSEPAEGAMRVNDKLVKSLPS